MNPVQPTWKKYDRAAKKETAPHPDTLVWIREEFYEGGVTLGYFDGFTFRTWSGSDDCSVSRWAEIAYPVDPDVADATTSDSSEEK